MLPRPIKVFQQYINSGNNHAMRLEHKDKMIILMALDLIAMIMAFVMGLVIGHHNPFSIGLIGYYNTGLAALIIATFLIFFTLDLYSLRNMPERFTSQILYICIGLAISAISVTFIFFFVRNLVPRAVFLLFYAFSFCFAVTFRYIFNRVTLHTIYWKVVIVGEGGPIEKVARLIRERKYLHTTVVGYFANERIVRGSDELQYLGPFDHLQSVLNNRKIDYIIVATDKINDILTRFLLSSMKIKVKVIYFRKFIETIAGKVPIDFLNDTWLIEKLSSLDKRYFWYGKRSFDIIISFVGLLTAIPFLLFISLLIKIDSPGTIFYSQTRIGRGGKPFRLWKIRTMVLDADKNNVYWTTDNDTRITRCGKFLRKVRIDEAPQLVNILKGDMSLIGPRPEAVNLVEMYQKNIPYYMMRHMVTPGITGWAQINYPYGNSIEDTREKLKYDFYYIKNRSLILDAIILLRTIRTVLTGKGAL